MQVIRLNSFKRDWKKLSPAIHVKAEKALRLLITDRAHPSLQLKRLQRLPDYWEIRIDIQYSLISKIAGDTIVFVAIGAHEILDRIN